MTKPSLALAALIIAVVGSSIGARPAHAASFDPSRIIDDSVFIDSGTMTVSDIQNFLNSKVPTCDTNGTMPASDFGRPDLTHAQYAASQGWPAPPYTCLKDYSENSVTSAQLIYNLSQKYHINPQVLIVTLQKESSLVTDYWPLSSQYKTATGYGCPDSGPNNSANCDSTYYGFTNQLTWTATMYRSVLDQSSTWYSPYIVGTNYIQWNPNANCGGTNVNIQNLSTVALYDYTPYQPNAAALNAGYGMGDSCSAYGNRNFFLYFNDWFGPSVDRQPIVRSWQSGNMYIRASDGTLYYITNADQLADLGYGYGLFSNYLSVDNDYINAHGYSDLPVLVKFGSAPEVYSYTSGVLHYIDYATYQAYGSPAVGNLDGYVKNTFTFGGDVSTVARNYKDGSIYSVASGKRRYVVGPDAYAYYSLGNTPLSTAGPTILSAVPEGAPLAKPGTVVSTSDLSVGGVVSEDGNGQYPLGRDLNRSLQVSKYYTSSVLIGMLPSLTGPITNLAKDANNNYFLLDRSYKLNLTQSQFTSLGYDAASYSQAPSLLLDQLPTQARQTDKLLVQIGGQSQIYQIQNRQLLWFETSSDLQAFGYKTSDAYTITRNTYDTLFSFNNVSLIPGGLLVKSADSPSTYLVSPGHELSLIPTAYLFSNIGYSFGTVRTVSPQTLASMATQANILPYASDTSGQLWLLYGGEKRLIPPTYVANYSLAAPQANQITSWQLDALPRTYNASQFIRIDSGKDVYMVDSGQTHLLSLQAYLSRSTNQWNDITPVSQDLFNVIPQGTPYQ